jgi:hypothetical protein
MGWTCQVLETGTVLAEGSTTSYISTSGTAGPVQTFDAPAPEVKSKAKPEVKQDKHDVARADDEGMHKAKGK